MAVLSIVIPAYNEERFIGTLLRQIKAVDLAQLGIEKEIIVVDDCSRDGTRGDRCGGTRGDAAPDGARTAGRAAPSALESARRQATT